MIQFFKTLFASNSAAPEIIRAKAFDLWKAQGGGNINPEANWFAAIEQLRLQEQLSRRSFILELIRLIITSLSTTATIFGVARWRRGRR